MFEPDVSIDLFLIPGKKQKWNLSHLEARMRQILILFLFHACAVVKMGLTVDMVQYCVRNRTGSSRRRQGAAALKHAMRQLREFPGGHLRGRPDWAQKCEIFPRDGTGKPAML